MPDPRWRAYYTDDRRFDSAATAAIENVTSGGVSDVLVKDNMAEIAGTFLNDSGTGTVTDGNYTDSGTGWSAV